MNTSGDASQNPASGSPEPLSITGISVSPNQALPPNFDSPEGDVVIRGLSGTHYSMKWYTNTSGRLEYLIGTLTERLSETKQEE